MRIRLCLTFLPFFALLALLAAAASAHTVTFTLAVNIDNSTNNTIRVNGTEYNTPAPALLTFTDLSKKYISANNTTTLLALASAGNLLHARINTSYNSTHYMLQMTQDSGGRFLLAATNGTYADVEDRLSMIDAAKMVSSTFGRFAASVPQSFRTFIRLEYSDIDLDFRAAWSGTGKLRIRSRGSSARNIPNITIEAIQ